jgi:hypothetical protein
MAERLHFGRNTTLANPLPVSSSASRGVVASGDGCGQLPARDVVSAFNTSCSGKGGGFVSCLSRGRRHLFTLQTVTRLAAA